jgi:hypothetical protein
MIAGALIVTALLVVAVIGRRLQRRTATEQMLSELEPGLPVAEVAARLQRVGIEFTTASAPEGSTLLRFRREVRRDGAVSEQQAVFDGQGRLLGLRSVTQIGSP